MIKIGTVVWATIPNENKVHQHRPAVVVDIESDGTLTLLEVHEITSQYNKDSGHHNLYYVEITDIQSAGLPKPSWINVKTTAKVNQSGCKVAGSLSEMDFNTLKTRSKKLK